MSDSASGPATSPVGPQGHSKREPPEPHCQWCHGPHFPWTCPHLNERDPLDRGLFLVDLLSDLAALRAAATATYAEAFLAAPGTDAQRAQAAKLAAADDHMAAELAAAKVAGYRLMIGGTNDATS
jgi:hypothetical protein